MLKKAFISYRREDSAGYVRALHDRLVAHFDPEQIFMDVDDIALGTDFVQELNKNLQGCIVMLVVIGPQWLHIKDHSGQRRLDKANDFVRLEISRALENKLTVIPVLVNDAMMPAEQDLPEALRPLARRQALELNNKHYHHGVNELIRALEEYLGKPQRRSAAEQPAVSASRGNSGKRTRWPWVLAGLCLLAIAIVAGFNLLTMGISNGIKTSPLTQPASKLSSTTDSHNTPLPTEAAGFDCGQASNDVEDAICNHDENRLTDQELNRLYQGLITRLPPVAQQDLKTAQLDWLRQRNTHIRQNCFTQPSRSLINRCIINYYQQRISVLHRKSASLFSRAQIADPPTNVRNRPNGDIICRIRSRRVIKIYTKPVREADGDYWYRTQACDKGQWGVVHDSQLEPVH